MSDVYIGKNSPGFYITSIDKALNDTGKAVLKARGNAIKNAVDVAELCEKRIMENRVEIKNIKTDTNIMNNDGEEVRVSVIEIEMVEK